MKRFEVLYCDGKCSIREMPGEFRCDPDGLETRLVKKVADYFNCKAKQVGTPATHVEVDIPDDYEQCGICGMDHAYDLSDPRAHEQADRRHKEEG